MRNFSSRPDQECVITSQLCHLTQYIALLRAIMRRYHNGLPIKSAVECQREFRGTLPTKICTDLTVCHQKPVLSLPLICRAMSQLPSSAFAASFPSDCLPPEADYLLHDALFGSINAWAVTRGYAFPTRKSTKERETDSHTRAIDVAHHQVRQQSDNAKRHVVEPIRANWAIPH